jgi:hypothetical protein
VGEATDTLFLAEDSQASPAGPSDRSRVEVKLQR